MKKVIILLIIIGFCLPIKAQLTTNDKNWNSTPVLFENFNPPHSYWDTTTWIDSPNNSYFKGNLINNVTHHDNEHQLYRKVNAKYYSSDSTMKLHAQYAGGLVSYPYDIPPGGWQDTSVHHLYYYSGAITAVDTFKYGYFETRCKLPCDTGSFPAFWLYNQSSGNYREIDIFEYSWFFFDYYGDYLQYPARRFLSGVFYGNGYYETYPHRYHACWYAVPPADPDLTNYHIYGVEWSPKRVIYYFDNNVVGELYGDSLPSHAMYLMLNNAVDDYAYINQIPNQTSFPNDMTIDFVRVNKLKCGCDTNAVIQTIAQLNAYYYSVKKTVTVDGNGTTITVPSNSKIVFRATDEITITKDFEVPLGSELELITHECPQ